MRNNLFEQISRQWDALFLKTRALNVFYWKTEKEKQIVFPVTKEYGRRDVGSIYVFGFISVCVVAFLQAFFIFFFMRKLRYSETSQ